MNATLRLGEHFIFDLSNCNHEIIMDYCAIGKDMMPLIQRIKGSFGADNFTLRKIDRDAEVERIPFNLQGLSTHSEGI